MDLTHHLLPIYCLLPWYVCNLQLGPAAINKSSCIWRISYLLLCTLYNTLFLCTCIRQLCQIKFVLTEFMLIGMEIDNCKLIGMLHIQSKTHNASVYFDTCFHFLTTKYICLDNFHYSNATSYGKQITSLYCENY